MLLVFVVVASLLVIAFAVGVDVGQQIWAEKRAERKALIARQIEAINLLQHAITKRFEERMLRNADTVEMKVVELHPQKTHGGRHRLTAA